MGPRGPALRGGGRPPAAHRLQLERRGRWRLQRGPGQPFPGPRPLSGWQPREKEKGRKKKRGEIKETGAWKCPYNLMTFVGKMRGHRVGGCLPRDPASLSPGLPSSPVFIWAKYVHAKVNSLPATHKLRMTCLAGLPYMESAVFQSSLPFAKFTGRKTPCMRGLLFFFFSFFPPLFVVRHSKTKKSKYRRSLGGAPVG